MPAVLTGPDTDAIFRFRRYATTNGGIHKDSIVHVRDMSTYGQDISVVVVFMPAGMPNYDIRQLPKTCNGIALVGVIDDLKFECNFGISSALVRTILGLHECQNVRRFGYSVYDNTGAEDILDFVRKYAEPRKTAAEEFVGAFGAVFAHGLATYFAKSLSKQKTVNTVSVFLTKQHYDSVMARGEKIECPVCISAITREHAVLFACGHFHCNICAPKLEKCSVCRQ